MKAGTSHVGTKTPEHRVIGENESRRQIVEVAERLFAEHGFAGVSLRSIVMKAGVNLAAIHYHFGTKEALFETIFERRARPLVNERKRRLAELRTEGASLEQILEAFLGPALQHEKDIGAGGATFARLRARLIAENGELGQRLQAKYFNESSRSFLATLAEILPGLPKDDLFWRFNFLLGSMVYLMADVKRIDELSEGACNSNDPREALLRLVTFYAEGFRLPPSPRAGRRTTRRPIKQKEKKS